MQGTGRRTPWRRATCGIGVAVTLAFLLALPAEAQDGGPTPEETCAPVLGTPEYDACITVVRGATGNAGVGNTTTTTMDPTPTGRELSEQTLEDQKGLLRVIVGVVMGLLFVVVAVSWVRGVRRLRAAFPPEQRELMERLVPPEVRAEHPDLDVDIGLTPAEQRMLRGQRNLVIALVLLPGAAFVLLQLWEPSVDTSVTIGEVARVAPLVLALPALWWARRRVRKALEAGQDRWSVLGLRADSGPAVTVLPRIDGSLRAAVFGPMTLVGVRHGRDVRIDVDTRSIRTAVHQATASPSEQPVTGGPGSATLSEQDGWLVLERTLPQGAMSGPDGLMTVLRDLDLVERALAPAV